MKKEYSSISKEVEEDFNKWFDVVVDPEPTAKADHPKYFVRRRRVKNSKKIKLLVEAFIYGIYGAIILVTFVVLFIEIFSYRESNVNNSSYTTVYIIFTVVIGFFVGMSIGLASRTRN